MPSLRRYSVGHPVCQGNSACRGSNYAASNILRAQADQFTRSKPGGQHESSCITVWRIPATSCQATSKTFYRALGCTMASAPMRAYAREEYSGIIRRRRHETTINRIEEIDGRTTHGAQEGGPCGRDRAWTRPPTLGRPRRVILRRWPYSKVVWLRCSS